MEKSKTAHSSNSFQLPERIEEGERNDTIFRYGCSLRGKSKSDAEVTELLKAANESRCKPPMSKAELERVTRSALSYGSGKPIGSGRGAGEQPEKLNKLPPTEQAAQQLEALFAWDESVIVVQRTEKTCEGKYKPAESGTTYVAGRLISKLRRAGSLKEVFPGYNEKAGLYLCHNPMKKSGGRADKNVESFRHILLEFDNISLEEQWRFLRECGLPISSLTFSGGKSFHALVRVDAEDAEDYKAKAEQLYAFAEKRAGKKPDTANRNPSRLTRLAGARRGEKTQTLLYVELNMEASFDSVVKGALLDDALTEGKVKPHLIAGYLLDSLGACAVDGIPAIRSNGEYLFGQKEIEKAVLGIRDDASSNQRNEVVKLLNLLAPAKRQADPKYIRFENGILDIETMSLLPPSANEVVLNKIPHKWNPEAKSELTDRTFAAIAVNDASVEENLWEMFGLAMYRGHEFSRMVLLQGGGANGKSTLLNMLKCMLGSPNWCSLSIHKLGDRFQLVPTMGKLAVIGDDIASGFVGDKACAAMKKFVTGETVEDEHKGGAAFQFEPYATLIYSCNEMPRFAEAGFAFERRVHPIPLSARFTPGDSGYDPNLSRKLCQEECIEYAIVRAVEALKSCLERCSLTPNPLTEQLRRDMLRDGDPVISFVNEAKANGVEFLNILRDDAYKMYLEWCEDWGYENVSTGAFSKKVCKEEGLRSVTVGGKKRFVPTA